MKKIWQKKKPSASEIKLFFENIEIELPSEKSNFFALKEYSLRFIDEFNKFVFTKKFGFIGFDLEDIFNYLFFAANFEFSLNKKKGKNILYGIDHVRLRRDFFNQLPKSIRKKVGLSKLRFSDLIPHVLHFFDFDIKLVDFENYLVDILDLGMAHSIYLLKVKINNQIKGVVIKKKEVDYQMFYTKILTQLGWPSYKTAHYSNDFGNWEFTEFLGAAKSQGILQGKGAVRDPLLEKLAAHAALGDILGHGDRHLENYIYKRGTLYPIDISFLFWPDNEQWIHSYVLGGVYEFNILAEYQDNPELLKEKIDLFFMIYAKTFAFLIKKKEVILKEIETFFSKKDVIQEVERKKNFFLARIDNSQDYIDKQKQMYLTSFLKCLEKSWYKKNLTKLAEEQSALISKNNLLKMYYLANKDRIASFYLSEKQNKNVLLLIKKLAKRYLE
ncbi:MAG: hypothetical protein WC860_09080 [Candidatus Margulisiibacteriota bacterium]